MDETAHPWEIFWENSILNQANSHVFQAGIQAYGSTQTIPPSEQFVFPGAPKKLAEPMSALHTVLANRKSTRIFTSQAISFEEISYIFGSLRTLAPYHRTYASAGALYPVEFFCLMNQSKVREWQQKALYYNSRDNEVSVIGDLPDWEEYGSLVNADITSEPAFVMVFGFFDTLVLQKYGQRGGRFIMHEVGQSAQNFELAVTEQGLGGYFVGGSKDHDIQDLLGLSSVEQLRIAGCYVGGHIVREDVDTPRTWRWRKQ